MLTKSWCSGSTELNYRVQYFGWLDVWVLSPDWRCQKLDTCDYW